jgi:hypothetical protein
MSKVLIIDAFLKRSIKYSVLFSPASYFSLSWSSGKFAGSLILKIIKYCGISSFK